MRMSRHTLIPPMLVGLLTMILSGCAGTSERPKQVDAPLVGSLWELATLSHRGTTHPVVAPVSLTIDTSSSASGSAGCNGFRGSCTIDGKNLRFGPLAATKKLCMEPQGIMDLERQYLIALNAVDAFTVRGDELILTGRDETKLVFYRRVAP